MTAPREPWGPLVALRGILARPLASYYLLLASAGMLLAIGLVMVFSATSVNAYITQHNAFAVATKQARWAVIGLIVFWICHRLPARTYRRLGGPLMIIAVPLLAVMLVGSLVRSHQIGPVSTNPDGMWLYIGPLQVQPSEFAKLALVLWGSAVLVRKGPAIGRFKELALPLFPVVGLVFLLVGYADLGTMLCLVVVFGGLLWVAGVRFRVFGSILAFAAAGAVLLIGTEKYRMDRLTSFLHPERYANSVGLQAVRGYWAIGQGGWFGVGLGESRLKWGYLPNPGNDFIFAIIAEELGVVGCMVVLGLFAVLAYAGLRIARRVDDPFRRLAAGATTLWLCGQAVINISAVVGLLPITGLPLPLISAGGSALVVTMAAIGMLASFARAEPDASRALHARPPAHWVRLVWAPLPPLPAADAPARNRKAAGGRAPARGGPRQGRDRTTTSGGRA